MFVLNTDIFCVELLFTLLILFFSDNIFLFEHIIHLWTLIFVTIYINISGDILYYVTIQMDIHDNLICFDKIKYWIGWIKRICILKIESDFIKFDLYH
jgi:hypothetical protein